MASDMDPRDKDTMKWLGDIIEVGGESNVSKKTAGPSRLSTSTPISDNSAAPGAAALASGQPRPGISQKTSSASFARSAALGAISDSNTVDFRKTSSASNSGLRNAVGSRRSSYRTSQAPASDAVDNRQIDAATRRVDNDHSSTLASPIIGTKNPARYGQASPDLGRNSSRNASQQSLSMERGAANIAATRTMSRQSLAMEQGAANTAASIAARDSVAYEVPTHRLSSTAGKAALLAHKDYKEYQVPAHKLAKDAGKAATLAHKDHVEYEVPEHELSANAGKAALLAANDHVEYEVPAHELSKNASTAALQAHTKPVVVDVPVHQMSADAAGAALLAHREPVNTDVPIHQLSANAGKAALLAHHDHEDYVVPDHELSANAGKAALLAHRDSQVVPAKVNPTSAASAANALKAAAQAHADPAMRPTKPEDLQAKGAASALRAASQAHRDREPAFKYVHPADDPEVGKLARSNTQKYLADMEYRSPHQETIDYANISYNNAKLRGSQSINYGASEEAYRSAGLSYPQAASTRQSVDARNSAALTAASGASTRRARAGTSTSNATSNQGDLMALARKNVDAQMAARGLVRTESQATVRTVDTAANRGAHLAFKEGQDRAVESERQREISREELEINDRINREMAKFDQQRKRNENSSQVQSALMAAAKRNARQSLANMEANRPYGAPNLQDTARMEDLLNEEKQRARRETSSAQVDIGGGYFMSQAAIEAVAAKRIQPVFAEMDEHVAEMNRRKAEIQAQKEAEEARKAAEKAARKRENELRKERERNTKEAERKAKEQKKADDRAAAEKRKAEARAAAEKKKEDERIAAEQRRAAIAEEKAALEAKRAEERAAAEQKRRDAETAQQLTKTESTEAVATAQATSALSISAPVESATVLTPVESAVSLPGTNAPLPGQYPEEQSQETSVPSEQEVITTDVLPVTEVVVIPTHTETHTTHPVESVVLSESADSEFLLAPPLDSTRGNTGEALATYQIENRGMATDTEGETDDEWVDASDETPAIERAEYVNVGQLTDSNLIAHGGRRRTLDPETASNATAKPSKVADAEDVPAVPTLTPAQAVFSKTTSHETATRFKEDLA